MKALPVDVVKLPLSGMYCVLRRHRKQKAGLGGLLSLSQRLYYHKLHAIEASLYPTAQFCVALHTRQV